MILIVGGACQGKLEYALKMKKMTAEQVSKDPEQPKPIVAALESWLREQEEPMSALEKLLTACPDVVIVCDEVGSGVVPMERGDRIWRERVGRICCALAERADCVIRMHCGIPTVLKGEAKWS